MSKFCLSKSSAALISIHPEFTAKILSGDKRLEFRRKWATRKIDFLVIYATYPIQEIVAIASVKEVFRDNKNNLWKLSKDKKGGITRQKLFDYMKGIDYGFALELSYVVNISGDVDPFLIFGDRFRPPQSFRYLREKELLQLEFQLGNKKWESYL